MESPGSWTVAEHIIDRALTKHEEVRKSGAAGGSQAMVVATALREAGLLKAYDLHDALGFDAFDAEDILTFDPTHNPRKPNPAPSPFSSSSDSNEIELSW
jgi:hypothetical protein